MPAQKRPLENSEEEMEEDLPQNDAVNYDEDEHEEEENDANEDEQQQEDEERQQEEEDYDESYENEIDNEDDKLADGEEDRSSSSSDDDDDGENNNATNNKEEFILVRLSDIRKEVQCPICLGIIRKTRTVMECLHRFCRECIDKSMRLGNNECPACRTHCASRRSLRDDPNYDALIAAIYPDIDQYEEEELAFQEDEKARNEQIQAAIAQTYRRQTEALSKKRRSPGIHRRRRNCRSEEEDGAHGHDGGKDLSSADERCTEVKSKRSKRWKGQPSPAGAGGDGGGDEHDQEMQRECMAAPAGLVGSSEMLAWGKGGIRSNNRHGSGNGGNGKHSRSRLARLSEHLRNSAKNDNELDVQVVLVSLDEQKSPVLEHSFLCSRPSLSVGQLCQFIAVWTSLPPEKVEILAAKGACSRQVELPSSTIFEACKDDLKVLDSEETLAGLKAECSFARGQLVLAYRQKQMT